MIDHCISLFRRKQKEKIYQVYVTDALKMICENTGKMYGGLSPKYRYLELIDPIDAKKQKEETRTAQEVIDHIKNKMTKLTGG